MVKRGSNFIPLVLDTRLLVALNGKASFKNQLNATYIMALLVEHCKDVLSEEVYEELKERYDKTIEEQYREKRQKERERLELEKRKLEAKERELAIKEQNSKVFQEQTEMSIEKEKQELEINKRRDLLQRRARLKRYVQTPEIINEIQEIEEQLRQLGFQC
jgi:transcription initiation factor TFIID subunit TAF12